MLNDLKDFQFRPCDLSDAKSSALYKDLKKGGKPERKALVVNGKASAPMQSFQASSFSQRLQTENPFEDFRLAVENAYMAKSAKPKKEFSPDQASTESRTISGSVCPCTSHGLPSSCTASSVLRAETGSTLPSTEDLSGSTQPSKSQVRKTSTS